MSVWQTIAVKCGFGDEAVVAIPPKGSAMKPAYDEGTKSAIAGLELWANPHANPCGSQTSFAHWQAGWCYGKQLQRNQNEAQFARMMPQD